MTYHELEDIFHKQSGLLGISGLSSDAKILEDAAVNGGAQGHRLSLLAYEVLAYCIIKHIGAYTFAMAGLDTIIFTGGIGENSTLVRSLVCKDLNPLGIILDENANIKHNRTEHLISSDASQVKIWIIPTNEELVIARDTLWTCQTVSGKPEKA